MSRLGGQLALGDRLRTILVTAVLTSGAWLIFGGSLMREVGSVFVLREAGGPAGGAPVSATPSARPKAKPMHDTVSADPSVQSAGGFVIPVAGVRPEQLVDTFTAAREGGARVHDAIDIMAPRGTPVVAAASGTVEKLFTSRPGGLTIYVRSPDKRTITYYAHLDAYAQGLAERQQVTKGQQLGTVGFTGNADPSAPHLHFAVLQTSPESDWWEPSLAVNPYPLLTGKAR